MSGKMFSEILVMIMSKISTPKRGVSTPKHLLTRADFTRETSAACAADATEGLGGSSSAFPGGGLAVHLRVNLASAVFQETTLSSHPTQLRTGSPLTC
jgi:hypothetical protein